MGQCFVSFRFEDSFLFIHKQSVAHGQQKGFGIIGVIGLVAAIFGAHRRIHQLWALPYVFGPAGSKPCRNGPEYDVGPKEEQFRPSPSPKGIWMVSPTARVENILAFLSLSFTHKNIQKGLKLGEL